jgi:hypothetical protein
MMGQRLVESFSILSARSIQLLQFVLHAVVGEWGVGGGRECTVEGGERAAYIYG